MPASDTAVDAFLDIVELSLRHSADRLNALPGVLRAAGASSVAEHTAAMVGRMRAVELEMMTRFPVPTLTVDTTDPYDPRLDTIVEFSVR